jgi:hypothetical protein
LSFVPRIPREKEHTMISHFRPACLALALVLTAGPTCAQTWIYEPDNGARVYQPRVVYQERYVPRVYNSYAYAPVVTSPSVEVVATQRTVINRTIIPQGRGRGPIVRERIVSERYAPAPTLGERLGTPAADYAYIARRPYSGERVIGQPVEASYAYVVSSRDASAPRYTYEYDGGRDAAYCQQRFRSYDSASGTYMGYDGMRHSCP